MTDSPAMKTPSPLDPDAARRTLRRLHGEPATEEPPARADGFRTPGRIEQLWRALEPPTTSEPPPDFARRTAEALRRRQTSGAWSTAPAWARVGAAAALVAGLLLGLGLGGGALPVATESERWHDEIWTGQAWIEDVSSDGVSGDAISEDSVSPDDSWTAAWAEAYESSFGDTASRSDS